MTTPQPVQSCMSHRFAILANSLLLSVVFCLSAFTACGIPSDPSSNAPIPWSELGATATAQYSGDGLSIATTPEGVVRLRCTFQKLEGEVTPEGLWLTSTAGFGAADRFRLVAGAVGRSGSSMAALPARGTPGGDASHARFVRPGLVEEYSVSVDGVRQDFVVSAPPAGAGDLRVELVLSGARAAKAATGAQISLDGSGRKLSYSRLHVADATGRELESRIDVVTADRLAVVVADAGAAYPLRIDPTFSDEDWISLGGRAGASHTVNVTIVDGAGILYVGGGFRDIGNLLLSRGVAKWDGNTWTALGGGMDNYVLALQFSGTDLYAGGKFAYATNTDGTAVFANGIAKWNGTNWSALGLGAALTGLQEVKALAVSGTTVYAGGSFLYTTNTGGIAVSVNRVAKWDGTTWSALGGGVGGDVVGAAALNVLSLALVGSDLYVGGSFAYATNTAGFTPSKATLRPSSVNPAIPVYSIAKWNGTAWSALGAGVNGSVYALLPSGTDLYASGQFTTATNGTSTAVSVNSVAKWNLTTSAWSALGTGVNGSVFALAMSGTTLYAGGNFTAAGGGNANAVAQWNGVTWSPLATGVGGSVYALAAYGTNLYAGGQITTAGGFLASRIARWNGTAWRNFPGALESYVWCLAVSGNRLYAGGQFASADGKPKANHIAQWDGSEWTPLGGGLGGTLYKMAVSGTDLYACGYFYYATNSDGTAVLVNNIAKWDGTNWSALGGGANNRVDDLLMSGTDLHVGGVFSRVTNAGPTALVAPAYAKWDGTNWSTSLGRLRVNSSIAAMQLSGSNLYVGGIFSAATNAGGIEVPLKNVAKLNLVSGEYSGYDGWPNNNVNALALDGTTLYVGGIFTALTNAAGTLLNANCIARLDLTAGAWSAWGGGVGGTSTTVYCLAMSGTDLYVGGSYTSVTNVDGSTVLATNLAIWDGTTWSSVGSGYPQLVRAVLASDTNLYVGGNFTQIGGKSAYYVAQARITPGLPDTTTTLASSPNPSSYGESVTLTATLSTNDATGTVTFKDGSAALGTAILSGGVASFTTNGLSAGIRLLTADYEGDLSFGPGTSPILTQVVNQASATVSLQGLSQTYNGTARVATATTLPEGLPVTFTYDASGTAPINAGSYVVVGTVGNTNYTGAATNTLVVARGTPNVTTWPVASVITLGQALSASSLTGGSVSVPGGFGFATPATTPPVGSNLQSVVFTPDAGTNYLSVTGSVAVVVIASPTATTLAATTVLGTVATLNASINPNGAGSAAFFQFATGSNTVVSTLAGSSPAGYADGISTVAQFGGPYGVAVDGAGNVYVADQNNHRIRKVTSEGVVTTLAGSGVPTFSEGTGVSASFSYPQGIAVDGEGNVYVADLLNSRIRKITSAGVVTTLAGSSYGFVNGTGAAARFSYPVGIALDAATNLYVTDGNNYAIRKITPAGVVTTLAGGTQGIADGTGAAAQFDEPSGIAVDAAANVYVYSKNRIRKVTPAGVVTTLAGSGTAASIDGTGAAASFNGGYGGLAVDAAGALYVCDFYAVRKVTARGVVTTIAGSAINSGHVDGDGSVARFGVLRGVALDSNNNLFLADGGSFTSIRRVSIPMITSVVLAASGLTGILPVPVSLAVSNLQPQNTYYYTTFATNVAGSGTGGYLNFTTPATNALLSDLALSAGTLGPVFASNTVIYTTIVSNEVSSLTATGTLAQTNAVMKVNGTTVASGVAGSAINLVVGTNTLSIAVTAQDGVTTNLYTVSVWRYPAVPAGTTLAASSITSASATLNGSVNPGGVADAFFQYGTSPNTEFMVSTLAGGSTFGDADGTGADAKFRGPRGVALDTIGNVYVADSQNNRIRKVTPAGVVTTLAGSGTAAWADGTGLEAQFNNPACLVLDPSGNIYVADTQNNRIRKVTPAGVVTTLAGTNATGWADGTGAAATFWDPTGVALDSAGTIYVGDNSGQSIRKVTQGGVVTRLAGPPFPLSGYVDGTNAAARFYGPSGVAVDISGNVYVVDSLNHRMRKVTPAGVVTTLAGSGAMAWGDGTGTNASFYYPEGVALDGSGNIYVGDFFNHRIRKVTPAGVVTTLAGSTADFADGAVGVAKFNSPRGVAVDSSGTVYVADTVNHRIRRITAPSLVLVSAQAGLAGASAVPANLVLSGLVPGTTYYYRSVGTNIAGTAYGAMLSFTTLSTNAVLNNLALSAGTLSPVFASNIVSYATIVSNGVSSLTVTATAAQTNAVLKVNGTTVGSGVASSAINLVMGTNTLSIVVTAQDGVTTNFYTVSVWRYPAVPAGITLAASSITSASATLNGSVNPGGAADAFFQYGTGTNASVIVSTLAGSGLMGFTDGPGAAAQFNYPVGVAVDASGNVYVADGDNNRIRKVTPLGEVTTLAGSGTAGFADATGTAAQFNVPYGVAVDASGNVYVGDPNNHRIRKVSPVGVVTTLAGSGTSAFADGTGVAAQFASPSGVAVDASGNVYVADNLNQRIRKVSPVGVVTTLAGSGTAGFADGTAADAQFSSPRGVGVAADGNVYVADYSNSRIRKVTPVGLVTTLAGSTTGFADGTGAAAQFHFTWGVAVGAGGTMFVSDTANHRIRKVTPVGDVTTLAGSGTIGFADGTAETAQFTRPLGMAVDRMGNVYVADNGNHRIRKITPDSLLSVLAQSGLVGPNVLPASLMLTNLTPETTYYYRAVGTNVAGTNYGEFLSFVTLSTNAALSGLVANVGPLTPVFAAGTGTYWTGVTNGVTNMTITATVAQSNATVKVNGTTVASGTASGWISLVVGTSSIPVEVTAQDGTTITTYTVMVIREPAVPAFTSLAASLIGSNVVTLSVSMTPYDLPTGSFFQYGSVTNLTGATFSTLMDGVWNGMAPVAITNLVTQLIPDTAYYYRAGVTNRIGTNYSDILSFRTLPVNRAPELAVGITNLVATYNSAFSYTFLAGTFTDPDGNTLTYTAYGLPGGITLNSDTRTFSGTPTAAGSNWVTLVANDSYLNATNRFAIVVNKAAASVQLASLTQTYDGTPREVTSWTTPSNLTVSVTYNGLGELPVNAGSYTAVGTIVDANYAGSGTNTLTVAKAPLLVIADYKSRVYGHTNPLCSASYSGIQTNRPTILVAKGGGTKVKFVTDPIPFTGAPSLTTPADVTSPVGPYTITAALGTLASSNYSFSFTNGVLTVEQAVVTVAADNKSRNYGSTNPVFTASYTGWLNGDTTNVLRGAPSLTSTTTTNSAAGGYTIAVAIGTLSATNYSFAFTNATLTVDKAAMSITADATNRLYGATNPVFTGTVVGVLNGDNITGLYTSWANSFSPVATYDIVPSLSDPDSKLGNYTVTTNKAFLSITKAPLLVIGDYKSRVYGHTNPVLTASYSGFVNNEGIRSLGSRGSGKTPLTPSPVTGAASLTTTADVASPVGPYTITAALGTLASANYSFSFTNGVLTVEQAVVTVAADNKSRTYGSTNPVFTASYSGWLNSDNETILGGDPSLTSTTTTNSTVGTYTITAAIGTLTATNYSFAFTNGTLTVNKAEMSITANATNRVYGDANPAFTGTVTGVVNSDNITGIYATAATVLSPVATYDIVPSLSDSGSKLGNYTVTTNRALLTITRAAVTATADNKSRYYGRVNPDLTITYTGLKNGDTSGLFSTIPTCTTPAVQSSLVGSYAITAASGVSSNYTFSYVPGTLTVTKAPLLMVGDDATRYYGRTNPVFTAVVTGLTNSDNITAQFSCPATNLSPVGEYRITMRLQDPTSRLGQYAVTLRSAILTVEPGPLVGLVSSESRPYAGTNAPFSVTYSGWQNGEGTNLLEGTIEYACTNDLGEVVGSSTAVGSYPIRVITEQTATNYAVFYEDGTLTVTPVALTVTGNDATRVYGEANPTLTGTVTGQVNSDTISATFSTTATSGSAVGTYDISPVWNDPGTKLGNYTITTNLGTLTVTKAPLSVVVDNKSRTYGTANPALTGTLTGVVNSDNITPGYSTLANALTAAGTYPITANLNDPGSKLGNYDLTNTPGTLTITKAALSVTADNKSKTYGSDNPTLTASYSGFVNSENATALGGSLSLTTEATASSPTGTYTITPSGYTSGNYDISYTNGTLTVGSATLTVSGDNKTRVYGAANPALTGSLVGVVNGDSISAAWSTPATNNSTVGEYTISPVWTDPDGKLANYTISTNLGTLTITKASLTVTADNQSRGYGDANPALTMSYSGFVAGDTASSLTTQPTCSVSATLTTIPGTYTITPSGATSPNYTISYVNGTLTVGKALLVIIGDDANRPYGQTNPVFTASIVGVKNGDNLTFDYQTDATQFSLPGRYYIEILIGDADGKLAYYDVVMVGGLLTVKPAVLTGTIASQSRGYGANNNPFIVAYTGFVHPEDTNLLTGTLVLTAKTAGGATVTSATAPGTYAIKATGKQILTNYTVTYVDGTLTITQAVLTITGNNATRAYGSANPTLTANTAGFVNSETASVLGGSLTVDTTATVTSPAGSYGVTPSGYTSVNYAIHYVDGALTVTKAPLAGEITAATRAYGQNNPAYAVTYTGFLNGDTTNVLGSGLTFSCVNTNTTLEVTNNTPIGTYVVKAATPPAATNYSITIADGSLTITQAVITVVADSKSRSYGASNPTLTGTLNGVLNGDNITAIYGTTAVIASPAGTYDIVPGLVDPSGKLTNYTSTLTSGTLTITKAALAVTADNQSRAYGTANPALTVSYAGFLNGDTAANLGGTLSVTTPATASSPIGTYGITASGQTSTSYDISYTAGTLTVTKGTITVTADNLSKTYGAANPTLTGVVTGVAPGDNITAFYATTAALNSPAGTYDIVLRLVDPSAKVGNYTVTINNGTLTVNKATLTATADNKSRNYGSLNPHLTLRYSGFVNGEDSSVLTSVATVQTAATTTSPVGTYDITVTGGSAANYDLTHTSGTLTITKAAITVTVDNKSRSYGTANPTLTGTLSGVLNGDNITAFYATTAAINSPAGTYDIVVRLVDPRVKLGNYTTSLTNGTLTVKGDDAPVVTLTNSPWLYTVGTAAALVDTNATVTDGGSPNFDGGTLTVWLSVNGNVLDTLSYQAQGEAAGQIGQNGTGVTYGGALIATVAGGTGTTPLVFSLNTNATPAAVQALLRAVTIETEDESTNSRTLRVVVADGDGGISAPVTKLLALNRPPVAGPDSYSVGVNGSVTNTIASVIANDTDADGDTVVLESFSGVSANGGRIIQEGTNLIYRAPVGYRGADLFAYLIADGRGGEAVGVMTINVGLSGTLTLNNSVDGMMVHLVGEAGKVYRIEATGNMFQWSVVGSAVANPDGTIAVLDTHAKGMPQRFYRAVAE